MRGSCLQYAPAGEAKVMLDDIIPFLALWCRYPAAEYVWKLGFAKWFADRERGQGKAFAQVVNLRATRPDRLFPQLDKGEVKLLRRGAAGGWMDCDAVWLYQRLKKAGAVQPLSLIHISVFRRKHRKGNKSHVQPPFWEAET